VGQLYAFVYAGCLYVTFNLNCSYLVKNEKKNSLYLDRIKSCIQCIVIVCICSGAYLMIQIICSLDCFEWIRIETRFSTLSLYWIVFVVGSFCPVAQLLAGSRCPKDDTELLPMSKIALTALASEF